MAATNSRIRLSDISDRATVDTTVIMDLFDLDYDSVLKALRRGEIPGFKVGHVWRIPVPQLMRLIEGDGGPAPAMDAAEDHTCTPSSRIPRTKPSQAA